MKPYYEEYQLDVLVSISPNDIKDMVIEALERMYEDYYHRAIANIIIDENNKLSMIYMYKFASLISVPDKYIRNDMTLDRMNCLEIVEVMQIYTMERSAILYNDNAAGVDQKYSTSLNFVEVQNCMNLCSDPEHKFNYETLIMKIKDISVIQLVPYN